MQDDRDSPERCARAGSGAVPDADEVLGAVRRELVTAVREEIRRRGCSWLEVEEVVQEASCRLFESGTWSAVPPPTEPARRRLYLRRVARSTVVDELRLRSARKRGGGRVRSEAELGDESFGLDRIAPEPTPEDLLLQRERDERLSARLVAALPGPAAARKARIVELAFVHGWTGAEIAARSAELKESAVHSLLWRARRALGALGREALLGSAR